MRKLLLFIILIGAIGTVNAQWHFSITSMNYNDNCSGNAPIVQAEVEVWARIDIAKDFASKTYSTKEECESMRSGATMNWSSGGCYIRTTTSPCTGGNIGGGGISGGTQGTSQFSSTAIGEPYFAPNETYTVSQTGRDLEIKLEALNKSFNDAVGGIKTGDTNFDDFFRNQVNATLEGNDNINNSIYTLHSRNEIDPDKTLYVNIDKVYLGKENHYFTDDDDLVVFPDPQRIGETETEENVVNKALRDNREEKTNEVSPVNLISGAYKVGSGFVYNLNDGMNYIKETFGVTIPGSEKISSLSAELREFENDLKDVKEIAGNAFIGDLFALGANFGKIIKADVIDPYKEVAVGTLNNLTNGYSNTTNMLTEVGNPLTKAYSSFTKNILDTKKVMEVLDTGRDDNYKPYKNASRFNGQVAKMTKKRVMNN